MYFQSTPESYGYNQSMYEFMDEGMDVDQTYDFDRQPPTSPPPQQLAQQVPQSFFSNTMQPSQIRSSLCRCLGRWGLLGLRFQGPFGRDLWFYPTEIRQSSVTGYIWQGGRSQIVRYNYSQIRNFACF